jgi:hypothetical protein
MQSFEEFLATQLPDSSDKRYYAGSWDAMYSIISTYREGTYDMKYFGSYQGDFAVIIVAGDGTVCVDIGGYGSCSYCDAAEACETSAEFRSLISSTFETLEWMTLDKWVDKYASIKNRKTEENRWYYHYPEVINWVSGKLATLGYEEVPE